MMKTRGMMMFCAHGHIDATIHGWKEHNDGDLRFGHPNHLLLNLRRRSRPCYYGGTNLLKSMSIVRETNATRDLVANHQLHDDCAKTRHPYSYRKYFWRT